jgi:hypothetical protein
MRFLPQQRFRAFAIVASLCTLVVAPQVGSAGARPQAHHVRTAGYHSLTPVTVYGGSGGVRLKAGRAVTFGLRARYGLPKRSLSAVVLQVTATRSTANGSLRLWRAGRRPPLASSFAVDAAHPIERLVTVATTGNVAMALSEGRATIRVDLLGYYSAGGARLVTLPSTTAFDTRRLGAGRTVRERVVGRGVPRSADAVVLDLKTINPSRSGWLDVGTNRLTTDYVDRGRTEDVTTVVRVGSRGRVRITDAAGSLGLVGNVEGYYTNARTAGSEPYVPIRATTVFSDFSLREAATEDVTPSAASPVPARRVGAVAVMLHVVRAHGSVASTTAITAYADCAGEPALEVPGRSVGETYAVVPLGPDGKFTLDNSSGSVAVRVDVVGYFPATAPVTVPCVAVTDHQTKANPNGAVEIFDAQHFAHWSTAKGSPSLKSRWVSHARGFGQPSDVKLREFHGHQYLVVASSGGGLAVVAYPSLKRTLFETDQPGTAWHGIEMLPDGTIVAAAATADKKRGSRNGFVELYYRHGSGWVGQDVAVTCAPNDRHCTGQLADAHEVLWDPKSALLWGVGLRNMVSWSYHPDVSGSAPRTTEVNAYPVDFDTTGKQVDSAHDLQPVFGNRDLMWVSLSSAGVELFSKRSKPQCTLEGDSSTNHWCPFRNQAELQVHHVKSFGSRPGDGEIIETWPSGEVSCSACTATVHFFSASGREWQRTVGGTSFYRARWWYDGYQ